MKRIPTDTVAARLWRAAKRIFQRETPEQEAARVKAQERAEWNARVEQKKRSRK